MAKGKQTLFQYTLSIPSSTGSGNFTSYLRYVHTFVN